jgi:hypothetical protein
LPDRLHSWCLRLIFSRVIELWYYTYGWLGMPLAGSTLFCFSFVTLYAGNIHAPLASDIELLRMPQLQVSSQSHIFRSTYHPPPPLYYLRRLRHTLFI